MRAQPNIILDNDRSRLVTLLLYRNIDRVQPMVCRPDDDIRADKNAIADNDRSAAVCIDHDSDVEKDVITYFEPAPLLWVLTEQRTVFAYAKSPSNLHVLRMSEDGASG